MFCTMQNYFVTALGKDKKYTVEEIKKIIKDWGETPVFAKDRKALKGGK